jgi:hypothetical protein
MVPIMISRTNLLALALALTAVAAMIFAAGARATQPRKANVQHASPVVVELFTSQGCSSCPPADELLRTLRREQAGEIIPLAYHVDYWNYLGWSDPFSAAQWSQRQKAYAQSLRAEVYTPQAVINGRSQLVASSEGPLRREVAKAGEAKTQGMVAIDSVTVQGDKLVVTLRAHVDRSAGARKPQMIVALFEDGVTTKVTRGENSGRALVNDSIVRWQGSAFLVPDDGRDASGSTALPLDVDWRRDHLGIAAFVQDQATLSIYAAASVRVPPVSVAGNGNTHEVLRP